jgi:hypothetical protein
MDSFVCYRGESGVELNHRKRNRGILIVTHYLCTPQYAFAPRPSHPKWNPKETLNGSAARTNLHDNVSKSYRSQQEMSQECDLLLSSWCCDKCNAMLSAICLLWKGTGLTNLMSGRYSPHSPTRAAESSRSQELSGATPHSRGGGDVALRALVPLDELLHVHLEEDLPDGRGVLLVGEVGGDLPDGDGGSVQDGFAAVELVAQEVCRVPRRVGVAEDATGARFLAGASEGNHHTVFAAGLAAGALVGSTGLAGEYGEWEGHLDGWLVGWLVGS